MNTRLLAVVMGLASIALAQGPDHVQWLVDQSAVGPGTGALTDPFPTIAQAMAVAGMHDHIHVMPGVYTERVDITEFRFLHSMNGPEHTIIDASGQPGYYAVAANNLSEIIGFTIRKNDGVGIRVVPPTGMVWEGLLLMRNRIEGCPMGGIEVVGSVSGAITDSLITNNASYGVLEAWGANMLLRNCTLSSNGIGVLSMSPNTAGQPLAANCIIWGNVFTAFGVSAMDVDTCIVADGALANMMNGCMAMDPMFHTMMPGDYRVMPGSPCIDSGNPLYTPVASYFDFRGFGYGRIADGNHDFVETIDIGAMEKGGLEAWAMPAAGGGGGMGGMLSSPTEVTMELDAGAGNPYVLAIGMASMNPWNPLWGAHGLFYLDPMDYMIIGMGVQMGPMPVTLPQIFIPGGIPIPGMQMGGLTSGGMGMGNGIGFPFQALVQELSLPGQPLWWTNCEMVLPMM